MSMTKPPKRPHRLTFSLSSIRPHMHFEFDINSQTSLLPLPAEISFISPNNFSTITASDPCFLPRSKTISSSFRPTHLRTPEEKRSSSSKGIPELLTNCITRQGQTRKPAPHHNALRPTLCVRVPSPPFASVPCTRCSATPVSGSLCEPGTSSPPANPRPTRLRVRSEETRDTPFARVPVAHTPRSRLYMHCLLV